jgi:hypothetical protein
METRFCFGGDWCRARVFGFNPPEWRADPIDDFIIQRGVDMMVRIAILALAAVSVSTAAQAGKCSMSSASGLGVTKEIATFMSNKAVSDMIAKNGEKGVGKVATSCDSSLVVSTTCVSKQRSCK